MNRIDVAATLIAGGGFVCVLAPVLGQMETVDTLGSSLNNLRVIHGGMMCYSRDWNGRQFTAVPDDFGAYEGNCFEYIHQTGCYPPLYLGWSCGPTLLYQFGVGCSALGSSVTCGGNLSTTIPINFNSARYAYGSFRLANARPLHEYLGGRFYDPVFYASADTEVYAAASEFFPLDCEFASTELIPTSYALSPAAMYHPDVMRAPSRGGFQSPESLPHGYVSPAVDQALHPNLKTWMIENNWLRTSPARCHPAFEDPWLALTSVCSGYLFNHGLDAAPASLFYDGSTDTLRTADAVADDARILMQSGGVDGLWSRDTPFGATGYYGEHSFDGVLASHHMFTTDGIRGRDRLRNARPSAAALSPGDTR
ncbi:MAG: hypothetical protein HKO59_04470 [Phycisphaerales bacterium]|nr:hypothetical protein [Phycisphaerae bacterium]NNF43521.1 hypothetical protein [Phycisphaerales bacterium]NNM25231.1 hypothetical protein [Phycisphaerales bacterium]